MWQVDVHGSLDPRCFMYLTYVGDVPHARQALRADIVSWAERSGAPGAVVPLRSGSAVGWRTQITTRKGVPFGELQILYHDGWEYELGYRLVNFGVAKTTRLGDRFLDSFIAPATHVGNQS
jgi:hypothetical protein